MARRPIPVIDLFAGPGGLAEGFSAAKAHDKTLAFRVALSIEKDAIAHQTLELRSFFRSFIGQAPDAYYDYLRGRIERTELFGNPRLRDNANAARVEACHLTLGPATRSDVSTRVAREIRGHDTWVLIGGPPCQAYSLIGRARMRSKKNAASFEKDERHFLYKEYLRIIAEHEPSVFIMENVKGLLSSTINDKLIFDRILRDLENPGGGDLRYRVVPLTVSASLFGTDPRDFVLQAERLGIPQTRHRVILCGVRNDLKGEPRAIEEQLPLTLFDAIGDLPEVRSGVSRSNDSARDWHLAVLEGAQLARRERSPDLAAVVREMFTAARSCRNLVSRGGRFLPVRCPSTERRQAARTFSNWVFDSKLEGVTSHEARRHMRSDLYRYLFAAAYASIKGISPKLGDFPASLLPNHRNARRATDTYAFADRFRVQLFDRPGTTVTSHISKDGHYFIHPDPSQCRSLTVREAARIQTFPDNYHFEGNRTQQFHQVGNAVPPLLALQIAECVCEFLLSRPASSTLSVGRSKTQAA